MENSTGMDLRGLTKEELLEHISDMEKELTQIKADLRGFVQEHVVTLLLADRLVPTKITTAYQAEAREMFSGSMFLVVCLQLDNELFDWNGARQAQRGYGSFRYLRRIIQEQDSLDIYPAQMYDKMACIVNLSPDGQSLLSIERQLLKTFSDINARLFERYGQTAEISISGFHENIHGLPAAYRQSLRLVEYRHAYGDQGRKILFYDHVLTASLDFENVVASSDRETLPNLVKRAIEAQFKNDMLNISMLANQFHVSASYITRTFKAEFGRRPWEYIQELRIKEAKELLVRNLNNEHTIKTIAQDVGFGNASNMIRIFKRFEGITPGEFMRNSTLLAHDAPIKPSHLL